MSRRAISAFVAGSGALLVHALAAWSIWAILPGNGPGRSSASGFELVMWTILKNPFVNLVSEPEVTLHFEVWMWLDSIVWGGAVGAVVWVLKKPGVSSARVRGGKGTIGD